MLENIALGGQHKGKCRVRKIIRGSEQGEFEGKWNYGGMGKGKGLG
jgi:hypothetical protein